MKIRIIWLAVFLLVGFLGVNDVRAQTNLLSNGNFEVGNAGPWNIYGNLTFEVVTDCVGAAVPEPPIEGDYCLHIVVPKAGAGPHEMGMSDGSYTFEKGKKYTASCFIKTKSGTLDFRIKPEHSAPPWEAFNDQVFTATEEWQEFYVTTNVFTDNVSPASPSFHLGFAPGDFWMDNIKLYEGDYIPSIVRMTADNPSPEDGATDVRRDVVLTWKQGPFAETRNVYFGTTFDDVNNADVTSSNVLASLGQTGTTYDPDGLLEYNRLYYWRVDEIDAPPDSTVHKGEIWSFLTETFAYTIDTANINATASSTAPGDFGPEHTIDGSGLNEKDEHSTNGNDMWLSDNEPQGAWIQYEFDRNYKLYEMWVWNSNQGIESVFGLGFKDVTIEYSTDGTDWTTLAGVTQFNKAPSTSGYVHNTTVDFDGAVAKYVRLNVTSNWGGVLPQYSLSEVRFYYVPVLAEDPSPDSGAADVNPAVTLNWRAGREAAAHQLYLSTDEQDVIDGTVPAVSITGDNSYSTDLDLSSTYYWRIDEVNDAEIPTIWPGEVWTFSTSDYLVVDDFESYNDIDPPDSASHRIFESWIDGYSVAANGALVGYDPPQPSYCETIVVNSGKQSMPLFYDNNGGAMYSEVTRAFAPAQDWTMHGAGKLVINFQGAAGNTGQLYTKINGVKVTYPGNASDLAQLRWKPWDIDLASLGVNPRNITTMAIGIDGAGAAGTLYVDDIRLYRLVESPVPSEELWIEAEAADSITAPMQIYDDPEASGGKYISTDESVGDVTSNPPTDGIATYNFTVAGGDYKISIRVRIPDGSNSFWFRIPDATIPASTELHSSGWVRWNDTPDLGGWFWSDVFSDDDNEDARVLFTLAPGTHTLEVARREDGTQLDVIVISRVD